MRTLVIGVGLLIGVAGCAAPPPDPNRTERLPARSSVDAQERQVKPEDQPVTAPALPIVPPGAPPPHATDSMSGPGNTGLTKPN